MKDGEKIIEFNFNLSPILSEIIFKPKAKQGFIFVLFYLILKSYWFETRLTCFNFINAIAILQKNVALPFIQTSNTNKQPAFNNKKKTVISQNTQWTFTLENLVGKYIWLLQVF